MNTGRKAGAVVAGLILTLTSIDPAQAGPRIEYSGALSQPCDPDAASPASASNQLVPIYVTNNTSGVIHSYWRSYDGERSHHSWVNPGGSHRVLRAYLGHVFELTNDNLRCLKMFQIKETASQVNIEVS